MKWTLLGMVVLSTVLADLLQSHAMRQGGKKWKLPLAIAAMAVSFFSFTELLKVADLSFAVPASAASLSLEILLARLILRESVDSRRWAGAALVAFGVILLAR
ncbi:MAG: EamA family transporter [Bryobacterales bacterium]|nr:EamA family transporter [Bryobacterales bacterium]